MASGSRADYGTYAAVVGSDGFEAVECKLTKHRKGPYVVIFSQAKGGSSYNYEITDRWPNRFICHVERNSDFKASENDEVWILDRRWHRESL